MIHSLSESVIVPIAGLILAFVMTLEFINIIIERNNLHDFEITNIYMEYRHGSVRRGAEYRKQRVGNHCFGYVPAV